MTRLLFAPRLCLCLDTFPVDPEHRVNPRQERLVRRDGLGEQVGVEPEHGLYDHQDAVSGLVEFVHGVVEVVVKRYADFGLLHLEKISLRLEKGDSEI